MEHFNKINHLGFEGKESCPFVAKIGNLMSY